MSYILLRDFERERIDPLLNRPSQGIGKIGKKKLIKLNLILEIIMN